MSSQGQVQGVGQSLLSQPLAVDFIDNRMWSYHNAYNAGHIRYNPAHGQFTATTTQSGSQSVANSTALQVSTPALPRSLPGIVSDMDFWIEVFPRAMTRLKALPEPKAIPQWDLRRVSNWPDAQAKLDMARREYDFHHNSQHVGKFRRNVRGMLDKSATPLQQITKAIPSMDITSPIVRVADLLLDAYRQASEVRETVNCGFDDLPVNFSNIEFYFKLFPGDENLLKAAVQFVYCTLKAIEDAILFYTSEQAKRAGLVIFTGEEYQRTLQQSLTDMCTSAEAFMAQANMSYHHHAVYEHKQNRIWYAAIKQDNWLSHQALGAIMHEGRADSVKIARLECMLNTTLGLLEEMRRESTPEGYRDKLTIIDNWPHRSPVPSRPVTPLLIQPSSLAPRELWSRLSIPNVDESDIPRALENIVDVLFPDLCRAEQVMTTSTFRTWFLNPSSSKLLIHGDFDTINRFSPLSTLCATIIQGLRLTPGVISLVFFCGSHLRDDEFHGGDAMVRSLTAQLLRQYPFPNIELGVEFATEDLRTADTTKLSELFLTLVHQIPAQTPIFCMIDGINEYENEEFLHTMDEVILTLVNLAGGDNRVRFKLLLTSPRPTFEVKNVFVEPGTLLHLQQLPHIEERMNFAGLQTELGQSVE